MEQSAIANNSVLDSFVEARAHLTRRKCVKHFRIYHDKRRLVERPYQVLSQRMIDGGFAAYGAVNLSHQCGGNLYKSDSAQVGGGGKSGQITNDPSADSDDDVGALDSVLDQKSKQRLSRAQILKSLAVAN